VPAYFTSDVHLRLDRPDRARRFARWVDGLEPDDSLTIAGDLCDFWYASRQTGDDAATCAGMRALAGFRARGGALTILPGNHDAWLGPFYERVLGTRFAAEPLEVEAHGLRLCLVHGHRVGGRTPWKVWMESRAFLSAFQHLPSPVATRLDHLLERRNDRRRDDDDRRHLSAYRDFAAARAGSVDIVFIGHIHRSVDEAGHGPRLVIPGGWHRQSSYLKVDASGASLVLAPDPAPISC
jgi:UDP-2,3-diacylglucosamine hydrolase